MPEAKPERFLCSEPSYIAANGRPDRPKRQGLGQSPGKVEGHAEVDEPAPAWGHRSACFGQVVEVEAVLAEPFVDAPLVAG